MFFRRAATEEAPLPVRGKLPLAGFFRICVPDEDIYYDPATHQVMQMAHPAPGVWGYRVHPVPKEVRSLPQLLEFVEKTLELERETGKAPEETTIILQAPLRLLDLWEKAPILFPGEKDRVTVGREVGSDLTFPDSPRRSYMARRQAEFYREENQWYVMDLNSTNKTRVNGVVLEPMTRKLLTTGDEIQFADLEPLYFGHVPPWKRKLDPEVTAFDF